MSQKVNVKRAILLALHKEKTEYAEFGNHELAFEYFLKQENLSDAAIDPNYFKYYWKKVIQEHVFDDAKNRITIDLHKYIASAAKEVIKAGPRTSNSLVPAVTEDVEITFFSPATANVDPNMFDTYLTDSEMDELFSDDGGAMAATSVMITGGPGVGKSTVSFWAASKYKELYPDKKVAVVSSEMEEEDLLYDARKKPWMNSLDFILTSSYGFNLKGALEKIFKYGYDIIILDSFADICDKLKDFCGMSMSQAENYLLELMKQTKGAKNERKVYTFTLAIQQVTKGGNFAGSNKLKHNTTAMLELRKESSGDRYMVFTKNRRCGQHVGKKLYYFLGANMQVSFDHERWEREKAGDQDENETPNLAQEGITNQMLAQFGEISADSLSRARALLQQDNLPGDLLTQLTAPAHGAIASSIQLPEGITLDDIYIDETLNFHVLDLGNGMEPIFGQSKEHVIAQLVERFSTPTANVAPSGEPAEAVDFVEIDN